ncbi:MAG: hypothetical protein AAF527_09370 [Pseudomonadota bacterium]
MATIPAPQRSSRRTGPLRAMAIACMGVFAASCTSGLGGDDYGRSGVGVPAEAVNGTVLSVRQVNIEGTKSGLGSAGGAIAGGALGSTVGGGRAENIAVGVLGAIAGGLIGAAAEEGVTRQTGIEYTIQLERGDTIVVVQGDDQPVALAGQPVRVLYGDRVRIIPGA